MNAYFHASADARNGKDVMTSTSGGSTVPEAVRDNSANAPHLVRIFKNEIPEHLQWAGNTNAHDYDVNPNDFLRAATGEKQTIILPKIQEEFMRVVRMGDFDRRHDRVIDIGCGPFIMGLPLIRDGIAVDGIDVSEGMVRTAVKELAETSFARNVQVSHHTVENYDELKESYKFGMMNFVHQCCPDQESLRHLFKMASSLITPGGTLVVIGSHPKYLHLPNGHAYYKYNVEGELKDGDRFSGSIYDSNGRESYKLQGDTYWKIRTLIDAAGHAGFTVGEDRDEVAVHDLYDKESMARPASGVPAYVALAFDKPKAA